MMLKSPINATNTIKHTINNSNNNNMSDKVMIDLSNSKRIMIGGVVGVESDNSSMSSLSTTILPDPTPMKEDRRNQVQQQQQQQQHQSSHRKSISTGDVVGTTKKRKMVRFTSNLPTKATTTILFPTTTILTEEHCNELWYQKDELLEIKKEAKEVISRREDRKNKNSNSDSNSNKNDNNDDNDDNDDTHAGLERFTRQRAIWKRSSIHYILVAQKQVKEKQGVLINQDQQQDYLQNVSIRCSTWAKEAAFEQGLKDYCSIHDPLASLFASTTSTSSSDASASTSSARIGRRQDYPKNNNTKEEQEEEVGKEQEQEQEKRRQKQEQHYDELIFGTTSTSNNNKDNNNHTKKKTNKKMDCCNNTSNNNIHNKGDRRPFKKRRIMRTIEV
jgi:hypothetical protein